MGLARIAARSAEPLLAFGTDEDASLGIDPEALQLDLGSDVVAFARKRIAIAQDMLRRQETRTPRPDQGWVVLRRSVGYAVGDVGRASTMLARQIGGVRTLRDAPGSGRDPLQPVPAAQQREALTAPAARSRPPSRARSPRARARPRPAPPRAGAPRRTRPGGRRARARGGRTAPRPRAGARATRRRAGRRRRSGRAARRTSWSVQLPVEPPAGVVAAQLVQSPVGEFHVPLFHRPRFPPKGFSADVVAGKPQPRVPEMRQCLEELDEVGVFPASGALAAQSADRAGEALAWS